MKNNLIKIAVATTLGFAAFTASAEDMYRGAWYAAPGISYMNTDSDLDADNKVGAYPRFGKELSEKWDIQMGLMYHNPDEDTGIAGMSGKYKQTALSVDALYMFSRDKFRPFLLAGLGVAHNDVDYKFPGLNTDNSRTSWLGEAGLGFQYLFSDKWGMQTDVRYQASQAKYNVSGVANGSNTETIGNTLFNLGVIYRFGEPAPVVVAEVAPEPAPAPVVAPEPAPAPAPAPEPVCTPQVDTITISGEELFGFDKSKLSENGKATLDQAIDRIRADAELRIKSIIVTGHTDRIGSEQYNQKLSEKRVAQVKEYMISKGVDESILQAVGKGESDPLVACDGVRGKKLVECLAPNRRVEVRAEGVKDAGCK
jgi:OOP family OmpA-OmpF porin